METSKNSLNNWRQRPLCQFYNATRPNSQVATNSSSARTADSVPGMESVKYI